MNRNAIWRSVSGIAPYTDWGIGLFLLFCLIGIGYIANQTLRPGECICSWSFLSSFAVALGRKFGILGTSALIASLFIVLAWEFGYNVKEKAMVMFGRRARHEIEAQGRAEGRAEGATRTIDRILDDPDFGLTDAQRRILEQRRRDEQERDK